MASSVQGAILLAFLIFVSIISQAHLVSGASLNLVNRCSFTVWPAFENLGTSSLSAADAVGVTSDSSALVQLPDEWNGRVWGRTGCRVDSNGINLCDTGECGNTSVCFINATSLAVTLAEFSLGALSGLSFYDISVTGGFNLPLSISPSAASSTCNTTSCTADVNAQCPAPLQIYKNGTVFACSSPCNTFDTPQYCCTGNYSSPSTCVPNQYSEFFKRLCPNSYTQPFDDASAQITCNSSDFTINFCSSTNNVSESGSIAEPPAFRPESGSIPEPPASHPVQRVMNKSSRHVHLILGVCMGVILTLALVVGSLVSIRRMRKNSKFPAIGPHKFRYKELYSATRGFSAGELLGEGGHGQVYKGVLEKSGSLVAVKRVPKGGRGTRELVSELCIISKLQHRNLVQLQGWCEHKGELLIVYEFMPNGSLDKLLYHPDDDSVLGWQSRYKIVRGLATALLYLHEEWEKRVVHRDVKASNVMLDANLETKLGDFGLARLIDHDANPRTTAMAGTIGYIAPELAKTRRPTTESDVYSFGIVALEVACGRQSFELCSESGSIFLLDKVQKLNEQGRLMEAADPHLAGNFDVDEMQRLLYVGLAAANPDPEGRPTMRKIVAVLTKEEAPAS